MFKARLPPTIDLFIRAVVVLFGELLNALAYRSLIVPAKLLSGGVVGTALLLHQLFNLPIGLQTIIYNIPIFLVGYRLLGRRFIVLSAVGVGAFSVLLDNIPLPSPTHHPLPVPTFPRIMTGIPHAILFRLP